MRQARFVVSLSAPSEQTVTVGYATVNGTAVAPTDYTATTGTLTFAPGETSKEVLVLCRDSIDNSPAEAFTLKLSAPVNANLGTTVSGTATLPAGDTVISPYRSRFNSIYALMKNTSTGYFGPPTGANAFTVPYHALEELIVEAPDWGHESVSETVSFFVKLEAWQAILNGDTTGYVAAWNSIESNFIPDAAGQPWAAYTANAPAQYTPDAATLTATPVAADTSKSVGQDPLYANLVAAYGTEALYLMHWLYDVDGVYGFHKAGGSTKMVPINNFQRGPAEDGWATITHPSWDDYANGGNTTTGWQAIYGRNLPNYSDAPAGSAYAAQWNYSVAPDAESRVISSAITANLRVTTGAGGLAPYKAKAQKMADYMQYALFDKYFEPINGGYGGDGCHYLLSWGCGFGGGMPPNGGTSPWGFRIGNSEIHFGYNCVDVAYACQTGGQFAPSSTGSAARFAVSLNRQLELIRWLQSPEGAIAGGVTSNYNGNYSTPTDGRQTPTFYGLYYNYSPSWHNPPSNNWTGYQVWGLERVANLMQMVAGSSVPADVNIYNNCAVILDKWFNWAFPLFTVDGAGVILMPTNMSWVESTAMAGTATHANAQGTFEYLPTLKWDSTGDYGSFWSASSVPNPSLHGKVTTMGLDLGVAAGFCQVAVEYCRAKKLKTGALTGVIPNGTATYQNVLDLAINMLDSMWTNYQDPKGFGVVEDMSAFSRMNDTMWIPPQFGTGHMPDGSVLGNGVTTFQSMRAFYHNDPMWPEVATYLAGGAAPSQKYHRFWANTDVAVAYAMLEEYFPETAVSA